MFNIFLCFVVLPYFVVRYLIDRSKSDKYDAMIKSKKKMKDDWIDSVTDMELEKQLQRELEKHIGDSILDQEFEEAIREVPGILEYERKYEPCTIIERIGISYALMIMLANRGKVTYEAATFGVKGSQSSCGRYMSDKEFAMIPQLMKWINKKLVEHGIDERPVLKWGLDRAFIIDDFEKCVGIGGGEYSWEPSIALFNEEKVKFISEE